MKPNLISKNKHSEKDQIKSDKCNKFIGRGSFKSSTHRYMLAWGENANCGEYQSSDTVFISAEGNRTGRVSPDFEEIQKACDESVDFVTDNAINRLRDYNIGEREVACFLESRNYKEILPGVWSKKI